MFNRRDREELDAHITGEYEDVKKQGELEDNLYDILQVNESIEKQLIELVNQGDKQIEFLSRLVTLFEGAAREARSNNGA